MNYVIAFIVAIIFALSMAGREAERTDSTYIEFLYQAEQRHNGLTDKENWELQKGWDNIHPDTTYIVTWDLVNVYPIPCPSKSVENEYGIKGNYTTSCAVLHLGISRTKKQKEFDTEIEADKFIENMPTRIMGGAIGAYCDNPKKNIVVGKDWELIRYEGDFDIQEGDSIMVKKK